MSRRSPLTPRRWFYRRWHTLAVFGLATLVMAAAALGPCFARSVQEASVRTVLTRAAVTDSGLSISTSPNVTASSVLPPGKPASFFQTPIIDTEQPATFSAGGRVYSTRLVGRDSYCEHIHIVSGRCSTVPGTVVASTSSARALGLRVGQQIQLEAAGAKSKDLLVTLVGLYEPINATDPYWFNRDYLSSKSGLSVQKEAGGSGENVVDALFADPAYVGGVAQNVLIAASVYGSAIEPPLVNADVLLIPERVRLNDLDALRKVVVDAQALTGSGTDSVVTNLPVLIDQMTAGFHQAATVERVLTVQLVALALIAFAVIVAAAAGQRSRDLALARLRGRTPAGAARLFVGEMAAVVVVAFVPALAVALGLTALAGRWWLGPGSIAMLLPSVVLAAAAAAVVSLVTIAVIGWRVSRLPISELLREVPSFRPIVGVGALEAALATAVVAGLYLGLSGNSASNNGVSLMTPMLLAAFAGLLLGRLAIRLSRPVARRAWRRRRCAAGLAAASVGRRRGYRLATVVLCISAALVVFAGQQGSVAAANRSARAGAENGAAVVLGVTATSLPQLLDAVRGADPGGHYATTVALPSTINQAPVVAVDSRSFGNVADWGWDNQRPSAATLAALRPTGAAPSVAVTGSALTVRLADVRRTVVGGSSEPSLARPLGPVFLELVFRRDAGGLATASFGPIPASATTLTLTSPLDCVAGCQLRGMNLRRDTLDPNQVALSAVFTAVTTTPSGRPVSLGRATQWTSTTPAQPLQGADGSTRLQLSNTPAGLALSAIDSGGTASAQYLDLPVALPALYTGSVGAETDAEGYRVEPGLDGSPIRIRPAGQVSFVPRIGSPAILVDITAAGASVSQLLSDTQVWLARDDPAREAALVKTLVAHDVHITARSTSASGRYAYEHAAPALGADLTVAVALLAALIGLALLVLTVASTWRARVRDRTALRLIGLRARTVRRAALIELLTVTVVSVAVGAAVGVGGSRLILSQLPFFGAAPAVPVPVEIAVQWSWAVSLSGLLLLVLAAAAVVIARRIVSARSHDSGLAR